MHTYYSLTSDFVLTISSIVARKSNKLVGTSISIPLVIIFGHFKIPGTLIPPSEGSMPFPPKGFYN